ncbi:hypothetical protein MTR_2g007620 [Medicago truncatula]|uniref:Uncharacterized protein n=1 Tax=Medicago truncatula TaxID=3880 RepID=A2Q4A1_MEDTR|nr:hypothetical protein MtrDRAFT_AC157375g19v1 [Medicago truncatula]AES63335.2 hypothetical protein MTR_2g007620 [Medicago truncatula]
MTIHRPVTTHLHRRHRRLQPLQPTSSFFLSVKHSVSSQNKMKAQPREGNGQMAPDPSIREPRRGMRVKITNRSSPQTLGWPEKKWVERGRLWRRRQGGVGRRRNKVL